VLRQLGVQYFAASVDSPDVSMRFARSLGLDYPVLSDPTKETARAFGVLGITGFAQRWTFFIDGDGRILAIDKHVKVGTHGADVVEQLRALGVRERT
jgi:thioredoxin-dependent peroxiredoxin